MTYQDQIIRMTENANQSFLANIKAIPADKLNEAPEGCRTPLDLFQEVAQSPMWCIGMITTKEMPDFSPEMMEQFTAMRKQWDSVEKCEAALNENTKALVEAIRSTPDEDLSVKFTLPFGKGMEQTIADLMAIHYWNTTYHTGQICYVQTMNGDTEYHD